MRRPLLAVFAGVALIELALLPPGIKTLDEISMYTVAESLVNGDGFHVPCELSGVSGVDGCYSAWYPLLSILAVPLVAVGELVSGAAGVDSDGVSRAMVPVVSALCAAGAAAFTAGIARRMGASWGLAVLAAVAFAFGTEALTHARTFFAETLCALLVTGAVYALGAGGEGGRRRALGLAALVLGPLAKPPMVVVGPALGAARAWSARDPRKLLAPSVASAVGVLVYMGYNQLRFGDPLQFGGAARDATKLGYFSLDAIEALGLFTISPGRGMLWFSPVAVLGAAGLFVRRRDPLALACGLTALGLLAIYLGNPGVDANWATRYLVPAIALLCAGLVALPQRLRKLTVALIVAGMVIQIPTTVAFYGYYYAQVRDSGRELSSVYWSVDETPLIRAWPAMFRQLDNAAESDVEELIKRPKAELDIDETQPADEQELHQVVALWWWMLPGVGIPRIVGILASLALVAGGVLILRTVARADDRPL